MLGIGLILGIILGANISLVLYALILAGSRADNRIEKYHND